MSLKASRSALRHALLAALVTVPGFGFGCAGGSAPPSPESVTVVSPTRTARQAAPVPQADAAPVGGAKPAVDLPIERKIIFNGRIEVVVKDFDAARADATKIVEGNKGYFAKSEVIGDAGSKRTGTFTIKVPAEKFQATVDAFTKLGVAVKNNTDSQDVTEEFVDISARVKNLKAEEEVFNRLLKDAAGRLEDVFKIREQIRQVRGDIERAEGRLKALSSLAALSTIVLSLREQSEYVPPTVEPKPEPPTFVARVSGTFEESFGLLKNLGQWVALVVIAVLPWTPLAVVLVLALRWMAIHLHDTPTNGVASRPRTVRLAGAGEGNPITESPPPSTQRDENPQG